MGQQDDATRKAILDQLNQPYEQGGVTGGLPGPLAPPSGESPASPTPTPTDYTQMGQYANRLGAYNSDKFTQPWDQRSEKYQIGTVLSHFDPNQGLTPEAIAALNGANIHGAKFSGSRDKLTVDNAGGWDRFGTGGTGDVIGGFNDPNNTNKNWGAWFVDPQTGQAQPQGGGGGIGALGGVNALLQGDPTSKIQQELQALINGSQSPVLRNAIQQMLGGQ